MEKYLNGRVEIGYNGRWVTITCGMWVGHEMVIQFDYRKLSAFSKEDSTGSRYPLAASSDLNLVIDGTRYTCFGVPEDVNYVFEQLKLMTQ